MIVYQVVCGKSLSWYSTYDEAKAAANAMFDNDVDGIPFLTEFNIKDKSQLVSLLNMAANR